MATIDVVLENIEILKYELLTMNSQIQKEIFSVIVDGSVVRGDFIECSSDIDITITTVNKDIGVYIKNQLERTIKKVQNKLPVRKYPQKPLIYDIQWQDMKTVKEIVQRKLYEWNSNNVPSGYPKLWLYAFDSIKHHKVIYGQDITGLYTKIPPKLFVPIRIERIIKSVENLGNNISVYESKKGGITQIKNAWETIRCICIANGLESINKNDVYNFAKQFFKSKEELLVIEQLYEFFHNPQESTLMMCDFREKLYNFTLSIIKTHIQ